MPGRWQGTEYRYGFQSQEMDDEIKGHGNSISFGARIYDSRIAKWFSTDAYKASYPSNSPYSSNGNNPLFYIDKAGNFLIPVHKRIVQNAFGALSIKLTKSKGVTSLSSSLNEQFLAGLSLGSIRPDVRSLTNPNDWFGRNDPLWRKTEELHFDNLDSKEKIDETWQNINNLEQKIISDTKANGGTAYGAGIQLGEVLHTVQDFYSHSNYIELYRDYYGDKGKYGDVEVQLYSEAIKDAGFNSYLEKYLVTGKYKAHINGGGYGDYGYDHKTENLDQGKGNLSWPFTWIANPVNWKSWIAEDLATKETESRINKYAEELEK